MFLTHEFVQYIPGDLKEGTIYISIEFATAVHKCCCGCGNTVVTPFSPTDWKLIFDGESISLDPSIGNWSFPCRSHYWIKHNKIKWAAQWSQEKINAGRVRDWSEKERYYERAKARSVSATDSSVTMLDQNKRRESFWRRVKRWLS
ncbi:MAG: DUF6527 family protein [Acidobacteriota bacterium]|nr:DUF6527 family protein [Acidobacteriota bacterium]